MGEKVEEVLEKDRLIIGIAIARHSETIDCYLSAGTAMLGFG
jgi:hypothetical protein